MQHPRHLRQILSWLTLRQVSYECFFLANILLLGRLVLEHVSCFFFQREKRDLEGQNTRGRRDLKLIITIESI